MGAKMSDIYAALMEAQRSNNSLATWQHTADGRDSVRSANWTIERGIEAYQRLSAQLRDGRKHIDPPDDYRLTSCGCGNPNASPPCSWCTDPDRKDDGQDDAESEAAK